MLFESEVLGLFVSGILAVSIIEIIIGSLLLKKRKIAMLYLFAHASSMGVAFVCLIRVVFSNQLNIRHATSSIENSLGIGLFGVFWFISIVFLILTIKNCISSK